MPWTRSACWCAQSNPSVAPVVDHEDEVAVEAQLLPEGEQELALFDIGVAIGPGVRELVGVPHTDQIAGD